VVHRSAIVTSDAQDACSQQVRQRLSLLIVENGMDALQGVLDGQSNALGTFYLLVTGMLRLGFVEGAAFERFGERRCSPTLIHRCLGALCLELIQNGGKRGDLGLVQIQFVRQEAQRTADTECAGAIVFEAGCSMNEGSPSPRTMAMMMAVPMMGTRSEPEPAVRPVTMRAVAFATTTVFTRSPPRIETRMHDYLQLPGAIAPPAGSMRAPCLASPSELLRPDVL
jgi:hypothetical protein